MEKNKIFSLLLLTLLVIGSASAWVHLHGLDPEDNYKTSDQTPEFCVTPTVNTTITSAELMIDSTKFGITTSVTNNTEVCITANDTLGYSEHNWNITVTDSESTTNTTATRTIDVSRFGSPIQITEDSVGVFSGIVTVVIGLVPILVILAVVGFVLGLFYTVFNKVEGKIRK